jgi:hypothetical protein
MAGVVKSAETAMPAMAGVFGCFQAGFDPISSAGRHRGGPEIDAGEPSGSDGGTSPGRVARRAVAWFNPLISFVVARFCC